MKITKTITVANDIGPCTGDGLDMVKSGVTLNLNGHSIIGSDTTNTTAAEQVGINLLKVTGVNVTGPGNVLDFDAGVSVTAGGKNTISKLSVFDNIAHVVLTGGVPDKPLATPCNFGDGITTDNSNGNTITGNEVFHNGPFSGISLVDASSSNMVIGNHVFAQSVSNIIPGPAIPMDMGNNGPCGPFQAGASPVGRPHQDIGIRVEGPGATNNVVSGNRSVDNQLEGISIHGNVCPDNPGGAPVGLPNAGNVIKGNTVLRNGFSDKLDGIGILEQGPAGIVCVAYDTTITGNTSNGNARNGIFVGGRGSHDNTITDNTVKNNGLAGIFLTGPEKTKTGMTVGAVHNTMTGNTGSGNAADDGADGTPGCADNTWATNTFSFVNQACVDASATVQPLPTSSP
ncbi:MAG: right-handed parallel beta-helix repeat-containing protein [Solirubrobacteraceae bacterium]